MSSLSDVAELARVSVATASRALSGRGYVSGEARRRVVAAAAEVGYRAGEPTAISQRAVTVVAPHLERWTSREALRGIAAAVSDTSHQLVLSLCPDEDLADVIEHAVRPGATDGLILVDCAPEESGRALLAAAGRPVALVGVSAPGIPSHSIDHVEAGRLATDHLIGLGHVAVAFLGCEEARASGADAGEIAAADAGADTSTFELRHRGFLEAIRAAGVTAGSPVVAAGPSIPGGFAAALALLADPRTRPPAIVAASDDLAIGAILAARHLGIDVPDGLSIVGIDGHELAETFSLTTVSHDPAAQGFGAVRTVLHGLESPAVAPVRLTVRSSTRAPREIKA